VIGQEQIRQMLHIAAPELYDRATISDGQVWISLHANGVREFSVVEPLQATAAYREGASWAALEFVGVEPFTWRMPLSVETLEVGVSMARHSIPLLFLPVYYNCRKIMKGDTLTLDKGLSVKVQVMW
jgi:hypothetical protein